MRKGSVPWDCSCIENYKLNSQAFAHKSCMVRCSPHHSRSVILAEAIEYARPFDQNLGSPLIYFFYLHTTIRLKYMVLFHLIFLLCTTIRPRLRVLTDLFFYLHTTIRQKCIVLFHLFFLLFTTIRPKLGSSLIYFF